MLEIKNEQPNLSTNTTHQIYEYLLQQYRLRIIRVEMELHKARQNRMNNNVQRYFNSTPLRNAFARWMVYGAYVNRFYSITELVKELGSNRQTVSTMIKECENFNFIIVKRNAKSTVCQAKTILIEKMEDYCDWRRKLIDNAIGPTESFLNDFENLMQNDLSFTNIKL